VKPTEKRLKWQRTTEYRRQTTRTRTRRAGSRRGGYNGFQILGYRQFVRVGEGDRHVTPAESAQELRFDHPDVAAERENTSQYRDSNHHRNQPHHQTEAAYQDREVSAAERKPGEQIRRVRVGLTTKADAEDTVR
jgi:hypothetical protein